MGPAGAACPLACVVVWCLILVWSCQDLPRRMRANTRIACVGDSITQGWPTGYPYPRQLEVMLDSSYAVMNFGFSGAYVLEHLEPPASMTSPYVSLEMYSSALNSRPDMVFIMLGTNDARRQIVQQRTQEFERDYASIISSFKSLQSRPKVYMLIPPPLYKDGTFGGMNQTVINELLPSLLRRTARANSLPPPIDVASAFRERCPDVAENACPWISQGLGGGDGCHPTSEGLAVIAQLVAAAVRSAAAETA